MFSPPETAVVLACCVIAISKCLFLFSFFFCATANSSRAECLDVRKTVYSISSVRNVKPTAKRALGAKSTNRQ
ncbi:hypothetical protein QR685DRAFT_61329 [Neurospora intermedia]|uniref:Secreted protein n=1 Tax=Neurospora intermedia TaxID=5142 RepID=A0ABR3DVE2_NEUIN